MAQDVTLPPLGESVTEGTVTNLLKKVGDPISENEPLLEISTDKVDTEIPSPVGGIVLEVLVAEDDVVSVGAVLARIGAPDEDASIPAPSTGTPAQASPPPEPEPTPAPAPAEAPEPAPSSASEAASSAGLSEVVLPPLGESVTEGTVTRWLKSVGDPVALDEPLLEISTDKVDTEIPSPVAGTLTDIVVDVDQTASVGAVLARVSVAEGAPAAPAVAPSAPAPVTPSPTPIETDTAPERPKPTTPSGGTPGGTYLTPLVRKLAAERGVDLTTVVGTGMGGRITRDDVLKAAPASEPAAPVAAPAPPSPASEPAAPAAAPAPAAPAPPPGGDGEASPLKGTTAKMSRLRTIISERMMESLHGMAQLTTVVEVDMSRVWTLRSKAKDAFHEREGAKLTFFPFFTTAAVEALGSHPVLNASIDGDTIVYHDAVHLGIAIDTDKGLIVPTIRNADSASLADQARAIADLGERARTNSLTPDDLQRATFTVTNTGSVGALFDTPIIPSPQVGILGTGVITKRPVVIDGPDGGEVIAIRPMCYLSITYDHRLVDGADAARFVAAVKARLEAGAFEAEVGM